MTGRALTIDQKREVLKRILDVWAPTDVSLGRLIVISGIPLNTLFSIGDNELCNVLETKIAKGKESK